LPILYMTDETTIVPEGTEPEMAPEVTPEEVPAVAPETTPEEPAQA